MNPSRSTLDVEEVGPGKSEPECWFSNEQLQTTPGAPALQRARLDVARSPRAHVARPGMAW
jgi:hypothetical protein